MSHHGFIVWLSRTTKDFSAAEASELLAHAKATVTRSYPGEMQMSGRWGEHAAKFDRLYAEGNVGACDVMKAWLIAEIDAAIEDS